MYSREGCDRCSTGSGKYNLVEYLRESTAAREDIAHTYNNDNSVRRANNIHAQRSEENAKNIIK